MGLSDHIGSATGGGEGGKSSLKLFTILQTDKFSLLKSCRYSLVQILVWLAF